MDLLAQATKRQAVTPIFGKGWICLAITTLHKRAL